MLRRSAACSYQREVLDFLADHQREVFPDKLFSDLDRVPVK